MEDYWHFLECKHPPRQLIFETCRSNLEAFFEETQTSTAMRQLFWDGICSIRTQTPMLPATAFPATVQDIYSSQTAIGWDQLFYGRFSYEWKHCFETASRSTHKTTNLSIGGSQWITDVTVIMWRTILQWWESRNADNNGRIAEEQDRQQRKKLRAKVAGIYGARHRLPDAACRRLFPISIDERMSESISSIEKWLIISEPYARAQIKVFKNQTKLKTQDIRKFFKPRPRKPPAHDNSTKRPT